MKTALVVLLLATAVPHRVAFVLFGQPVPVAVLLVAAEVLAAVAGGWLAVRGAPVPVGSVAALRLAPGRCVVNPKTRQARTRILACLAANPGVTAQRVGELLGLRSNAMRTLRAMQYDAEVIAVPEWRPQMGRNVSTWHVAPPGTVPPPRPEPDLAGLVRRRSRDTAARRELRATARGKPAPFSSLRGAPVPTRRLDGPACATADPGLFFPPAQYETPAGRRRRLRLAANFCSACPVRAACYQGAAERMEPWGVWGGVDFTPLVGGRRKAS